MIGIGDGNAIAIDIATTTAVTSAIIVVTANVGKPHDHGPMVFSYGFEYLL